MEPSSLTLAPEFESPFLRARLHVLLALASALRPHLSRLEELGQTTKGPEWHQLVDRLATSFGDQVRFIKQATHGLLIWAQFESHLQVQALAAEQRAVLRQAQEALQESLRDPETLPQLLADANRRAHETVVALLEQAGPGSRWPPPRRLLLQADLKAQEACASTNAASDSVAWAFQPVSHAVWGVLAVDHVFEHEYLSHAFPRSSHLSDRIREVWLIAALFEYHRNRCDAQVHKIQSLLWYTFRRLLTAHLRRPETGDAFLMEICVGRLSSAFGPRFWRLTTGLVLTPLDKSAAARADQLLQRLVPLGDAELRRLFAASGGSMADLLDRLDDV